MCCIVLLLIGLEDEKYAFVVEVVEKVWMMMHSEQITQQIADAGLLKFTPYTNHHYRSNHPFPSIFPSQDIWLL